MCCLSVCNTLFYFKISETQLFFSFLSGKRVDEQNSYKQYINNAAEFNLIGYMMSFDYILQCFDLYKKIFILNKYANKDTCMYSKHLLSMKSHQSVWKYENIYICKCLNILHYLSKSLLFLRIGKIGSRGHLSAWIILVTTFLHTQLTDCC